MFEPLRCAGAALDRLDRWPVLEEFNALLDPPVYTASGATINFVSQAGKPAHKEEQYEARIYLAGEVQTRTENWHDLFNALAWLVFPRTKAALNARHFEMIFHSEDSFNRGRVRDALTLFDESGIVVLYEEDELAGLIRAFRWKELFSERREQVREKMRFVIFGHSLNEKALNPYLGFTGKALLVKVGKGLVAQDAGQGEGVLDELLAGYFLNNKGLSSKDFSPLPILGVPGWWAENANPTFYENAHYFRPGKKVI